MLVIMLVHLKTKLKAMLIIFKNFFMSVLKDIKKLVRGSQTYRLTVKENNSYYYVYINAYNAVHASWLFFFNYLEQGGMEGKVYCFCNMSPDWAEKRNVPRNSF